MTVPTCFSLNGRSLPSLSTAVDSSLTRVVDKIEVLVRSRCFLRRRAGILGSKQKTTLPLRESLQRFKACCSYCPEPHSAPRVELQNSKTPAKWERNRDTLPFYFDNFLQLWKRVHSTNLLLSFICQVAGTGKPENFVKGFAIGVAASSCLTFSWMCVVCCGLCV